MRTFLLTLALVCLAHLGACASTVYLIGPTGSLTAVRRPGSTLEQAARQLVMGPTRAEKTRGLSSAIPAGASVRGVSVEGSSATVDLTGISGPLGDTQVDAIIKQIAALGEADGLNVRVLVDGGPVDALRYPETFVEPMPRSSAQLAASGALSGKRITVSPGHGWYWNGSAYYTQRGTNCALEPEDFHNLRITQYLNTYLEADGAIVYRTRETDMNRGNHPLSAKPWWQMCAPFYLYDKGYPRSVYATITGTAQPGVGAVNQMDDDRRSRPEASNLDGADLYAALHTNAFQGDCFGAGCPTGIECYADETQLGGFYPQSLSLAGKVQTAVYAAVRATYQAAYPCRNACQPRTNQAFTEIHFPRRPALLLEFGFHDSCDTDVVALKDEVFRSAGMWGYYKGICDYFGVTPTWDLRSYEIVSTSFPAVVKGGTSFTGSITLRNRGCVWNEQHQFRLGVANANPLSAPTRVSVAGNVGPGETVTFNIPMNAPATDGNFISAWRMIQDERSAWFGPMIANIVPVDASPPSLPVFIPGPMAVSSGPLQFSWQPSTDAISGVNRYEYRILDGLQQPMSSWISNGASTSVTIPGSYPTGSKYYLELRVVDNVGNTSVSVVSPGVVINSAKRIGQVKQDADGAFEYISSALVTATFPGQIYIQESDRSAGIRLDSSESKAPGQEVLVTGKLATTDGERALQRVELRDNAQQGGPATLTPLSMSNKQLGGEPLGAFTPGVADAYGTHNLGLYVRVWGVVTQVGAEGFRISDGSLPDGVWIECPVLHKPSLGEMAIVTGVSVPRPGSMARSVRVSADADIIP